MLSCRGQGTIVPFWILLSYGVDVCKKGERAYYFFVELNRVKVRTISSIYSLDS